MPTTNEHEPFVVFDVDLRDGYSFRLVAVYDDEEDKTVERAEISYRYHRDAMGAPHWEDLNRWAEYEQAGSMCLLRRIHSLIEELGRVSQIAPNAQRPTPNAASEGGL